MKTVSRGFTLIETIIYIGLLSILISGALLITYQILGNTDSMAAHTTTEKEGNFVLRKIDWTLTGVSNVVVASPTEITATKYSGEHVDIKLSGSEIQIQETSGGMFYPITTGNATVNNLHYTNIPASGTGPAGVSVAVTINGTLFELAKYLRK